MPATPREDGVGLGLGWRLAASWSRLYLQLAALPILPWLVRRLRRVRRDFLKQPLAIPPDPAAREALLVDLLKKVEAYQPIYGAPELLTAARPCLDRCAAIAQALEPFGRQFRLLDIGSSLGFFSLYFAERGAQVTGYDFNPDNVAVAQLVACRNGIPAEFEVRELNRSLVRSIPPGSHDVVLALSVFHHVIHEQGLRRAQELLAELCERVPLVVLELALRQEEVKAAWKKSLPADPLELTRLCQDVGVQYLGDFPTHLSHATRPLYLLTRERVTVNARRYPVEHMRFVAHTNGPLMARRYFWSPEAFIKQYHLTPQFLNQNTVQSIKEIENYRRLEQRTIHVPRLLEFETRPSTVTLVLSRIEGPTLAEALLQKKPLDARRIADQILQVVRELRQAGLYHNDVRAWNILINDQGAWLVDLALADEVEIEDTRIALLWLLWNLSHGDPRVEGENPLRQPPSTDVTQYNSSLRDLAASLLSTSRTDEFLQLAVRS